MEVFQRPFSVINVKGQLVARDGNSRLLTAQETDAKEISIADQTECQESRADLGRRTRKNGLPLHGTSKRPR